MTSSIGSDEDFGGIAISIYLTQDDIDLLNVGVPVDLESPDHKGGHLSVHLARERRSHPRAPVGAGVHRSTGVTRQRSAASEAAKALAPGGR